VSVPDALGLVNSTVDQIRFDECVDAGGFGTVYRGRVRGRDEPVAIKCLRVARLANLTESMRASIIRRFGEETKILHHLSHGTRDIVRCLSSGQLVAPFTGEPVPYMVLEWLEGRTLSVDLAERRERGLPGRTLRDTLDLIESAALAIAYAHTQGIIHRDIKPANLMLARATSQTARQSDRPEHAAFGLRLKVLDFGLAKILSGEPGYGHNLTTSDGVQLVSVAYCAPEQLSPKAGEIGPWTDIYSLALVMLEVMRGERVPHPANGPIRASHLGLSIPPPVDDLLARALSQNPLERPANANIFWSALRELTRQNTPHVNDASALAATAFAGDAAAALAKVRAAMAPGAPSESAAPAGLGSPFTGTMIMVSAPSGALHMLQPDQKADVASFGSTAPLAPPMKPSSPLPSGTHSAQAVTVGVVPPASPLATSGMALHSSPLASSIGGGVARPALGGAAPATDKSLAALPSSPLATSVGPGVVSPLAVAKPLAAPPSVQQALAQQAPVVSTAPMEQPLGRQAPLSRPPSVPPHRIPSVPPPPPMESRGPGLVIALLVLLVLAVLGAAGWMFLRPH
jgi:hypothetical protein